MTFGVRSRADAVAGISIVLVCPVVVALAVIGGSTPELAALGLVALALSFYIGLRHPLWLFWGLALVLGALPFGYFPGVHVPLYLPFAAGAALAALVHPSNHVPAHRLEKAVVLLILASGLSLVFTFHGLADVTVFLRWFITTVIMVALLRLPRDDLARFGRIYVYAATANALFGIAIVAADPNHKFIKILHIFNYDRVDTGRFVFTDAGQSRYSRLGGTWVDPNLAGVALLSALLICLVLLKGKMRVAVTAILSVALVLTLSRAAIFTVLAGIIVVALFHTMRARRRVLMLGSIASAAAVALLVPAIRTRFGTSFGSQDTGASDRRRALVEYPQLMSGHWPFGLGWGRREFVDGAYAFQLDIVSNAPLIAIYRAGMIVGLIFIAVLVMGCIMGYRALRSDSLPAALYGGFFITFCVVALQLDHTVVDIPQAAAAFAMVLAFLVFVDQSRQLPDAPHLARTDRVAAVSDPLPHYALQ